jgi:hypothetical protein
MAGPQRLMKYVINITLDTFFLNGVCRILLGNYIYFYVRTKHLNCNFMSTYLLLEDRPFHVNTLLSLGRWWRFCGYASFNGLAWDLQCRLCHIFLYYHIKCCFSTNCVFIINVSIGLCFSAHIKFVDDVYIILLFCNE